MTRFSGLCLICICVCVCVCFGWWWGGGGVGVSSVEICWGGEGTLEVGTT